MFYRAFKMRKWVCGVCGYEYKEETEQRPFEELTEDWKCPVCEADKENFSEVGGDVIDSDDGAEAMEEEKEDTEE